MTDDGRGGQAASPASHLVQLRIASQSGHALTFTHDALGRRLTESGPMGTSTNHYDAAGRRVRHDYTRGPSGLLPALYITYDHLVTGEVSLVNENGTTQLAALSHDDLGRRTGITYGNGATSAGYGYDAVGRLATLSHDLAGTGADNVVTFAYNPAGQIVSRDASNNSYAATGFANQNVADTHDGLNRLTASGGATITHDANGNLTSDGTRTYGYSSENRLTSVGGVGAYTYDPLGRLAATPAGYLAVHDGDRMTEEYNTGGARSAVYVPGPAMDEALASIGYLGDRYYLITDERGSVLNQVNESGVHWGTFKYDDHGMIMQAGGRWYSYTGQLHLPESGLLYYKARMYHPGLGRFLQPDPIGYMAGMNGYAGMGGDPVNFTDPMGLEPEIVVTGSRAPRPRPGPRALGGGGLSSGTNPPRFLHPEPEMPSDGGGNDPCRLQQSPGTAAFRADTTRRGRQLIRRWRVDASTGVVIQGVRVTGVGRDGTPFARSFFEGWEIEGGFWSQDTGDTDIFEANSSVASFSIHATARFYPGASMPSSMVPGGVGAAGTLPSSPTSPNIQSGSTAPIVVDFSCAAE